ncbi:putative lactoylglutathione lyase [Holospora elegans E1]|uniref:Putative lactoylglutathione lyase n=1 Tax=Holospora elegans E1 TaxID=1427503 RepID=A0A023DZA7_9PROT|nr:VOC family protein [Holospora elegans]GAJ46886.1 putative lactoylglutathione lyase [Holospora elegans E1]
MKLFNHVQIKVKGLGRGRKFYDTIMAALGYKMVLEIEGVVVGYGTSVHDMFEIRQFDEKSLLSEHVHLAFNASCKEDVDAFYKIALANGGKCNGEAGFRPQYEDGYYAAFVIDPDGHNIEAVYSEKAKVSPIANSSNC